MPKKKLANIYINLDTDGTFIAATTLPSRPEATPMRVSADDAINIALLALAQQMSDDLRRTIIEDSLIHARRVFRASRD